MQFWIPKDIMDEYSCHLTLNTDRIHSLNISKKKHNIHKHLSNTILVLKKSIFNVFYI